MMNFLRNFTEFRHTGESNLLMRCALWDRVQISPIPTESLPHWGCCCGQQPEFGTSSSSYKECQLFKSVQPAMMGCIDRWFQDDFFFFQQLGKESIPGFETCLQLGISALPAGSSAGPAGTLLLCSLLLSSASYPSESEWGAQPPWPQRFWSHTYLIQSWPGYYGTAPHRVCVCSQKYISLLSCMACSCLASSLLSLLEFSTTFVVVAFQVCLWSYRDICGFIYFLRGGKKSASLHSHSGKI